MKDLPADSGKLVFVLILSTDGEMDDRKKIV